MADRTWLEGDFSNPYSNDQANDGVGFLDVGKSFGSRAFGIPSDLGASLRALGENQVLSDDEKANEAYKYLGLIIQDGFGALEDATIDSMSVEAKRKLQTTVTDPAFWTAGALTLKAANMAPDIIAAAVPAVLFPGVTAAVASAAIAGGTLSASSVVDDMYRMTDEMSDEQLQKEVPMYRALREGGASEEQARAEHTSVMMGYKPLVVGVIGAVTNAFGPAGQAARVVGGGTASALAGANSGIAGRIAGGFIEGSASEAIQSGAEDYAVQSGAVEGGLQDEVNIGQTFEAGATGAVLGGILGGGISGVAGGRGRRRGTRDEEIDGTTSDADPATPPEMSAQPSASGAEATPGVSDQTATPAIPPVAAETETAAGEAGVPAPSTQEASPQSVTVVAPSGPDPAQAIALGAQQTQPAAAPVTPMVTPEVIPSEPVAAPAASPVSAQPETQAPVSAAPETMVDTTPATEPAPAPPVAETAPAGPRILEDVSPAGRKAAAEVAAAQNQQLDNNMAGILAAEEQKQKVLKSVTTEEQENVPAKVGKKAREAAIESKRKAGLIVDEFKPSEAEHGVFSTNVQKSVTSRKSILSRAEGMLARAQKEGVKVADKLKTNKDADLAPTPADVILTEAKELIRDANKAKATGKDLPMSRYRDFITREFALRQGDVKDVLDARRTEGDAAMKRGDGVTDETADTDTDSVVDYDDDGEAITAEVDDEAAVEGNPEDRILAKEEGTAEVEGRERPKPAKVAAMGEGEGYTVPKADRKAPKIEAIKKRKVNKPAERKPGEPRSPKLQEILNRNAAKKVAAEELGAVTTKGNPPAPKLAAIQEKQEAATTKDRVEKARAETNTNPTPAQAETGNYKKGRVSVSGLPIAIENPKGSIRSNKDPDGPKWSVKMPADYGYLEGTKGADGDAIDVYIGPDHDASYVFVVDQVDAGTGTFDEHKVMVGFKSGSAALKAYDKAFSDGLGMQRVGGLRKMTLAEFKAWAETDPTKRSDISEELANEAMSPMLDPDFERELFREAVYGDLREGYIMDPKTQRIAKPISSRPASDVIFDLDLSRLTGAQRAIAGNARNVLSKLVGDMEIHFVSPADIARLSGYALEQAPYGYHAYKGTSELVVIRADLLNNKEKLRHTVLHEMTHAATVRAINADRRLEADINLLREAVFEHLMERQGTGEALDMEYGMLNTREFIAETFSNSRFQQILATMEAPDYIIKRFGLEQSGVRSMWDALVNNIRKMLGLPKNAHSLLEASIRATERSMRPLEQDVDAFNALFDNQTSFLKERAKDAYDSFNRRKELAPTKGNPLLLGFRTFDSIARAADRYFGGNNPVRRVADIIETRATAAKAEFKKAEPVIQKLHDLARKYKGQAWNDFVELLHSETEAGVYADRPLSDQKHITKRDGWQKKQHPELARRYAALPADLKAARTEAMEFFTKTQNRMALKLIRNRIVTMFDTTKAGIDPDGLAQRIHDKTVTDADKKLMGEVYDTIAAAGVLSKIEGPYFPLMRRGNWVVKGRNKVTSPGNARKIADNEFEFTDKDAAEAFEAAQSGRPTLRTVYVDKTTGETHGEENGKKVRIMAEDMNAEARYRVVVQDRFMTMFDTEREARNYEAELRAAGVDVDQTVPRQFEGYGIQSDALSVQMRRMFSTMERRADARNFTAEQKHELMTALNEMSLSILGSTRIQSRSLPRSYVAGASRDLVRNTTDYAHAAGNYIAKLDTRPKLDAAMEELNNAVKEGKNDGFQAGRTAIQNEVMRRVTMANPAEENKGWNGVTSRILAMSFIDKLMSPSYSVINALQPMMTTAPYLAGQYGAGKAYSAMAKAYSDIGSMSAIKRGFEDTIAKMKPGTISSLDPMAPILARLNRGERAMAEILIERGVIAAGNGLEVSELVRSSKGIVGKLDKGIGHLEGIARQMPTMVEAINRTVTAVAAYRLEMERSGDVAKAVQFAQDTVNLTQFNYSSSNASPFMNHPVLRLSLQFKKYGIGMYQLLGEQVAIAVRNENPGDRAKALKSLSYTIGMHVLIAGAMGLPTEPIKAVVMAANGLGIVDWTWQDIESAQREAAADMFGKQFGEIVSRGIPRAFGVDLSSRMGIDTLMGPFGEPRSNEAQDWKAFVWDTVAGAPAGLVADWGRGINDLAEGDVVRAAERLIPIKALADSIKAYRTFTEGTISERSGKKKMEPYSAGEAALRAFGFQPAREAENFERSATFERNKSVQGDDRKQFLREWAETNGAARGRLWKEVQKWNRTQPSEARLTISELRGYQKRLRSDMLKTKDGILARKREQHILNRADETYNQ